MFSLTKATSWKDTHSFFPSVLLEFLLVMTQILNSSNINTSIMDKIL